MKDKLDLVLLHDLIQEHGLDHVLGQVFDTEVKFTEFVYSRLKLAILELEKVANKHHDDDEDQLSGIIAASLRLSALRCSFNQNVRGMVDLVIEHHSKPMNILGEAKIWGGPAYHLKAGRQILKRYQSGRNRQVFIIDYFRQKEYGRRYQELRTIIEENLAGWLSCKSCAKDDDYLLGSLISVHEHHTGSEIHCRHLPVNMYWEV